MIIIDEAHWIVPPLPSESLLYSPLTNLLSEVRETGMSLIVASQGAALEEAVMVNTALKVCFRLGHGAHKDMAGKSMSLTKEQTDYITRLDTGQAIVRIPVEDPFVLLTLPLNIQ